MASPGMCHIGKDVILNVRRKSETSPHAELETPTLATQMCTAQTSLFVSCWQDEVLNIFIYEARGCASS